MNVVIVREVANEGVGAQEAAASGVSITLQVNGPTSSSSSTATAYNSTGQLTIVAQ